jgi:hypothetical protein
MQQQLEQHGVTYDLYGQHHSYGVYDDFVTNFICGYGYYAFCGLENCEKKICDDFYVNGSCDDVCCENDAFSNGPFLFLSL